MATAFEELVAADQNIAAQFKAALTIDRDDDRVAYLTDPAGYRAHSVEFTPDHPYSVNVGVIRFYSEPTQVILTLGKGPFTYQSGFTIAEARTLALALNTACADAEVKSASAV